MPQDFFWVVSCCRRHRRRRLLSERIKLPNRLPVLFTEMVRLQGAPTPARAAADISLDVFLPQLDTFSAELMSRRLSRSHTRTPVGGRGSAPCGDGGRAIWLPPTPPDVHMSPVCSASAGRGRGQREARSGGSSLIENRGIRPVTTRTKDKE